MVSSRERPARGPATSQTEPAIQSTEAIRTPPYSDRYRAVDNRALGAKAELAGTVWPAMRALVERLLWPIR
jgi:hypothetical protein